jgi:hypothetical protein
MARCLVVAGDTVHVVWYDTQNHGSAIYYKRSSDQGTTWGPDTRLSASPATASFPTLAASGPILHLAFRDIRSGQYNAYYKRSLDGGRTWEPDVAIGETLVFNWWPAIAAVGPMVFVALNMDSSSNSEVYFRRSTDNGTTWGTIERISNAPLRSEDPCIDAADFCVHIVWNEFRHDGNGHSEIYYRRSSNQGATWGPETRLTYDTAMSYSPTVCASGSNVDVAWEDNRDGNFEIYRKRSTDYGMTWGNDVRMTNDTVPSMYPSVASLGTRLDLAWFSSTTRQLYYRHSADGGATWDSIYALTSPPARAASPFIVVRDSIIHLLWDDQRDGHGAIYYKRCFLGSTGSKENAPLSAQRRPLIATVISNSLTLQQSRADGGRLLDLSGRCVARLKPGVSDVSTLGPGVYFVQEARGPMLGKVVIAR